MPYLNVTEVVSDLITLASTYPALTELITLPNITYEGRTSHALRIGTGSVARKDAVLFIGGVHAREWGSCEICLNFATDLLEAYTLGTGLGYGGKSFTSTQIKAIVEGLHVFVFPLVNPDGRYYSQTVEAFWRRNRNPTDSGGDPNCVGVDVNRNYDFLWDFPNLFNPAALIRTSTDPCELETSGIPGTGTYHGSAPFSEAETKNVLWLLDTYPRIRWFVDLHSYSELILYVWGDDENQTADPSMNFMNPAYNTARGVDDDTAYKEYILPADLTVITGLANRMHDAIQAVRGKNYTVQQGFELYATAGTSDDYVYSRHFVDPGKNKVHGFVIEWGTEFQPPWSEMEQIILDISSGLVEFCLAAPG
jgi:murein tripeptide amidase MpaA